MQEYKVKIIPLHKNRKLINAVKKAGIETFNPAGSWNGYGYERLPLAAKITSLAEMRKFNKLKRELEGTSTAKEPVTEEEKISRWCKRLAKLANITIEEARAIADAKLKYKERQISMMEDRQRNHASAQREKLLNKMKRENPLRRIEDADHASAIMAASRRHRCSDYEYRLEEARFLAEIGEIDRDEVKDYARENMRFAGKKVEK